MGQRSNKKKSKKNSRGIKTPSAVLPSEYVRFTDKSSFKITADLLESLWEQTAEAGLLDMGKYPHIILFIPSKKNPDSLFKIEGYLSLERRSNNSHNEKK